VSLHRPFSPSIVFIWYILFISYCFWLWTDKCARRQSAASCAKLGSHVINIYLTIVMLTGLELHKDGKIQNTNCNISSVSKICNKSEKLNLTWLSFWNPMPVFLLTQRESLSKFCQIFTIVPQYSEKAPILVMILWIWFTHLMYW